MSEFWENNFIANQAMWGFQPAPSAIITKNIFVKNGIKNIGT